MSVPTEGFTNGGAREEPRNGGSPPRADAAGKTVTMAAVARVAGVSQGAISSLLNDRDYGIRVSPKTRERVFKTCKDLGYVPNDLRAFVRIYPELGETCLLVSDRVPGGIANPFVARLTASLMVHSPRQPASISVILYDEACDYGDASELPGPLHHGTASKVLCVGAGNASICRIVHERRLPTLVLGHTRSTPGVTSIVPDYHGAARLALAHFVRHGHRHVGIVGGPFGSHDPRLAEMSVAIGDEAALLGLTIHPDDVFAGDLNFQAGVAAIGQMRMRPSRPTALLCLSENAAAGVIAGAREHGMWVPGHLSVITFADHAGPIDSPVPITAVVMSADEIGSAAVREADRQIREGIPTDAPKITVAVRLIERSTCGSVSV